MNQKSINYDIDKNIQSKQFMILVENNVTSK